MILTRFNVRKYYIVKLFNSYYGVAGEKGLAFKKINSHLMGATLFQQFLGEDKREKDT